MHPKNAGVKRRARKRRTSQRCKPTLSVPLYLTYVEERSGGGVQEEQEGTDHPMHVPVAVSVTFQALHPAGTCPRQFSHDAIEVIPEVAAQPTLHVAVIRYSTGDEFNRTSGLWSAIGAYTTAELADVALKQALDPANSQHKPWEGHFRRVEQTEVHVVPVTQ